MHFRPFGRTDLRVSELALGTMHFGWKTDERASLALLDAYREAGGNFIEAATTMSHGAGADLFATTQTETYVGKWLARRDGARSSLVLATRLIVRDEDCAPENLAARLRATVEASLQRLRTDHLDVLFCEWHPQCAPFEPLLEALWTLVRDGLVRYVGASGFPAWRVMQAMHCSSRLALPRFEALQHDYSIVVRRPFETELADLCTDTRLAFVARSPLAGGFLVDGQPEGRAWAQPGREAWLRARFTGSDSRDTRDVLAEIAAERDISIAQAAFAWVLGRRGVTSALAGVTTLEQLRGLIAATDVEFTAGELEMLERPGTTAARLRAWKAPMVNEAVEADEPETAEALQP